MIRYLVGILKEKNPSYVVLERSGIGFKINIPLSIFDQFPPLGEKTKIYTYLDVKENELSLYGFLKKEDRDFFINLISLSKIGPRSALRMLSRITPSQFKKAILEKDLARLTKTPGIGGKTAQRIILELGEVVEGKIPLLEEDKNVQDGVAALISLGYTKSQAQEAIKKAIKKDKKIKENLTALIKEALKYV